MSLRNERAKQLDRYLINSCLRCQNYNRLDELTFRDNGFKLWRVYMRQEIMKVLQRRHMPLSCTGCDYSVPRVAEKLRGKDGVK